MFLRVEHRVSSYKEEPSWWRSANHSLEFISSLPLNEASLVRFVARSTLFRSTFAKLRQQARDFTPRVSIPIVLPSSSSFTTADPHIVLFGGNVMDWPSAVCQGIVAKRLVIVLACFTQELACLGSSCPLSSSSSEQLGDNEDEATSLLLLTASPLSLCSSQSPEAHDSLVHAVVHSSQQGARRTMEDFYVIAHQAEYKLFAVFDGHCGPRVAELCAELFSPTFRHHLSSASSSSSRQDYKHALLATVAQLERTILLDLAPNTAAAPAVLLDAESIIARLSGTCLCACVCAAKQLFVCNLGDSRAVLSRRGKLAKLLTPFDHNTDNADEVRRVLLEGGTVVDKRVVGENKGKYSSLSISRSIGDLDFTEHTGAFAKAVGISPLPDVFAYDLDEEVDEFVILGCDGVWEAVSADRACALVRQTLRRTQGDLQQAADELVGAALAGFATDNVTVLIAALPACTRIWQPAVLENIDDDDAARPRLVLTSRKTRV